MRYHDVRRLAQRRMNSAVGGRRPRCGYGLWDHPARCVWWWSVRDARIWSGLVLTRVDERQTRVNSLETESTCAGLTTEPTAYRIPHTYRFKSYSQKVPNAAHGSRHQNARKSSEGGFKIKRFTSCPCGFPFRSFINSTWETPRQKRPTVPLYGHLLSGVIQLYRQLEFGHVLSLAFLTSKRASRRSVSARWHFFGSRTGECGAPQTPPQFMPACSCHVSFMFQSVMRVGIRCLLSHLGELSEACRRTRREDPGP